MGYQHGDQVVREVSRRLLGVCRDSDTVARLGDNEFFIVLPGATLESAKKIAQKIQKTIALPVKIAEFSLEIEVVIGIAIHPDHGENVCTLLQHSDIAMRMAKRDGVGILVYNPEDDPFSMRRLRLHGELRQAIEGKELGLHYQPKVDIRTARIIGVEALARWSHPGEGMIPPAEFIPMIEQSGLIRPFTFWLLEETIVQLMDWASAGIDISIAVNMSMRNLLDPSLPATISRLLETYQVSAYKLCLEITESTIMSRPEHALQIISQLHKIGVRLSIDDFGTGYSSLAYLKKLSVDELKIDQSFIFGLTEDRDDALIVRSTIDLAHNLGLKTVAEGVESKEVMDELEILKCDIAQGYYISRPLPAAELQQWLRISQWGVAHSI